MLEKLKQHLKEVMESTNLIGEGDVETLSQPFRAFP